MKEFLLGKSVEELQAVAKEVGLPPFTAKQMADWIYQKRVTQIQEMSNISLVGREKLAEKYEVGRTAPVQTAESADGTKKYLFRTAQNHYVEAVYLPDKERATLCVSTQAGCKMGCTFCMTGALGFTAQLSAAEILNQIFSIPESSQLTNLVYMGMGEPMDNLQEVMRSLQAMTEKWGCAWSPHRITVSTVGIIPPLTLFLEKSECHLALSLHTPFAEERLKMMPVERPYPLQKVLELIKRYDFRHQRRISFEYIMFQGVNDSVRHAVELQKILRGIPCRINLIKYHGTANEELQGASDEKMVFFRNYLSENGIFTTIRRSRGEDILAACGMLVANS